MNESKFYQSINILKKYGLDLVNSGDEEICSELVIAQFKIF